MRVRVVCLIFLLVTYVTQALAWGQTGHRVVAEIATHHLDSVANNHIQRLTAGHSLAEISTWLDDVKADRQYKHYTPWHFLTWPAHGDITHMTHPPEGDIVVGYQQAVDTLQHSSDQNQRREALAVLVHLVGDAHQPLHVSNGEDKGGNMCVVGWFSKHRRLRLHKVWDSVMINSLGLSYTELAQFIDHPTASDILRIQQGDITDWLVESYTLHAAIYPATSTWHSYCHKGSDVPMPVLSYQYLHTQKPIMEKRMLQAGLRLAWVLNRLFK